MSACVRFVVAAAAVVTAVAQVQPQRIDDDERGAASRAFAPTPFLPPLRQFVNGTKVESLEAWAERRDELKWLLQQHLLGGMPPLDATTLESAVVINQTSYVAPGESEEGGGSQASFVNLTFSANKTRVSLVIEVLEPVPGSNGALSNPLRPVMMTQWNHREWAAYAVARGYVGVVYPGADAWDESPAFQAAFSNLTMGLIPARAYLASQVLDYVLTLPQVNSSQVAVTGHSRNGKQSLIFAAFDTRIQAVVGSSPGAPIATPYRFSTSNFYGESPRTGHVTCEGPRWWPCFALKDDGHPEDIPVDGHAILGLIAPRHVAIATGHQDFASDMTFGAEQNIREALSVFDGLYHAPTAVRNVYRYGGHHGFDDITTYLDWFDHAFQRQTQFAAALRRSGVYTADSQLQWPLTWLTPAGFDWDTWNATAGPSSAHSLSSNAISSTSPPAPSATFEDRLNWVLATGKYGSTCTAYSIGTTYAEESEAVYMPYVMHHSVLLPEVSSQAFSFGDYLSATAYFKTGLPVDPSMPVAAVLWLHPYAYNTGYSPAYDGVRVHEAIAAASAGGPFVVMAYDQIGFGVRNTQGGARFYARYGSGGSLLGHMIKDANAAVEFLRCLGVAERTNSSSRCSQLTQRSTWASAQNTGLGSIPFIDASRIYIAGYSLGGNVALHVAALDQQVAGVAAFSAFTPMRSDFANRSTGGLRRLSHLHALAPRLGLFADAPATVPYDYDELLADRIAPRPTLLYTPQGDRDATFFDVSACVVKVSPAWPAFEEHRSAAHGVNFSDSSFLKNSSAGALTHVAPDTITKMEGEETAVLLKWLSGLAE